MTRRVTRVKIEQNFLHYKKGQIKRICMRVAKLWEKEGRVTRLNKPAHAKVNIAQDKVVIRFLISGCAYKKGEKRRVPLSLAKKWERRKICKIIRVI